MTSINTKYVWQIADSPYPSDVLSATKQFGTDNPCYLVDQYSGRRPALINEELLTNGTINFQIYASALLDSNLAGQVHAIANGGKVRDGFRDMLVHLTKFGWDFSLYFYYIEHFCKAKTETDFIQNATARTQALLKLHSMDQHVFLASGEICPDPKATEYYLQKNSAASLDEVAHKRVHDFAKTQSKISRFNQV